MLGLTQLAGFGCRQAAVTATIDSNKVDFNLAAWLQSQGLWNGIAPFIGTVTIGADIKITASSPATAALTTGAFPGGSLITLINNGTVQGAGGAGGNGGSSVFVNGTGGQAGGAAISLQATLTIDNTHGAIFGGGGGGGGGAATPLIDDGTENHAAIAGGAGGGAGGGGAGQAGGAAGVAGANVFSNGGSAGAGAASAVGAGGIGGAGFNGNNPGGAGGSGGAPGSAGGSGAPTSFGSGGGGGPGGRAIALNTNPAPVFLGGNNSTQVRGAIS